MSRYSDWNIENEIREHLSKHTISVSKSMNFWDKIRKKYPLAYAGYVESLNDFLLDDADSFDGAVLSVFAKRNQIILLHFYKDKNTTEIPYLYGFEIEFPPYRDKNKNLIKSKMLYGFNSKMDCYLHACETCFDILEILLKQNKTDEN